MTQDAPPAIDASPIVAAPEGWRAVPVEPTRQMIVAAEDELENQTDSDYDSDADGNRFPYSIRRPGWERAVYQAMLAAAPPVPEGKAEPVAPALREEARNELARRQEAGHDARVPLTGPEKFLLFSDDELRALSTPEPKP